VLSSDGFIDVDRCARSRVSLISADAPSPAGSVYFLQAQSTVRPVLDFLGAEEILMVYAKELRRGRSLCYGYRQESLTATEIVIHLHHDHQEGVESETNGPKRTRVRQKKRPFFDP
jgi:hypothetical protein